MEAHLVVRDKYSLSFNVRGLRGKFKRRHCLVPSVPIIVSADLEAYQGVKFCHRFG